MKTAKQVVFKEPFEDDPDDGVHMEFRLTFEGRLRSANGREHKPARKEYKHSIREQIFGPQLRRLWDISPALGAEWTYPIAMANIPLSHKEREDYGDANEIAAAHSVGGYPILPFVRRTNDLLCALDILYLRRNDPGGLVDRGDIDNRLKTLFDVLSKPDANQGYENRKRPNDEPLMVLLENDRLITKISVETDYLLDDVKWTLDNETDTENDARLVITVRLYPRVTHLGNMAYL